MDFDDDNDDDDNDDDNDNNDDNSWAAKIDGNSGNGTDNGDLWAPRTSNAWVPWDRGIWAPLEREEWTPRSPNQINHGNVYGSGSSANQTPANDDDCDSVVTVAKDLNRIKKMIPWYDPRIGGCYSG
mmetsp:Transcript_802/g.1684  ORF Transcript_802/g.1684 Transcript_802/m.1684 type:complete len:127 (-) Transcript_802:65-445(-)